MSRSGRTSGEIIAKSTEAKVLIYEWRRECNEIRPNSAAESSATSSPGNPAQHSGTLGVIRGDGGGSA